MTASTKAKPTAKAVAKPVAKKSVSRRPAGQVTTAQVARLVGVELSVVCNWKGRYEDFPPPVGTQNGVDLFDRKQVVDWVRDMASSRLDRAKAKEKATKEAQERAARELARQQAFASQVRRIKR